MKKILFALMAIAALTITSCRHENDPEPPVTPGDTTATYDHGIVISQAYQFNAEAVSENGLWAAGASTEADVPAIWDVNKNVITIFEGNEGGALHAINNAGTAVGDNGDFAIIIKNNTVTDLYKGANDAGSSAYGITDDGSVIAGYYFDEAWSTKPCIWDASGARHDLALPTENETGFAFSGGEARWISGDGSVIAGFLMDDYSTWPAVIWRKSGNDYVCEVICKDYFETDMGQGKPYMMFGSDAMALSHNGEWLTLVTQEEFDAFDFEAAPTPYKAARFNLKTKQLQVADRVEAFYGISNDGTTVGCITDMMSGDRVGYIWKANDAQPTVFTDEYKYDEIANLNSVSPAAINGKGDVIVGSAFDNERGTFSFVIR